MGQKALKQLRKKVRNLWEWSAAFPEEIINILLEEK